MQDKTRREEPALTLYIQMVVTPNMNLFHSLSKKTKQKRYKHAKEFKKTG